MRTGSGSSPIRYCELGVALVDDTIPEAAV